MDPYDGAMARSLRKRLRDGESVLENLEGYQYKVAYDVRSEKEELEWMAAQEFSNLSTKVEEYHKDPRSADTPFNHENPATKPKKADCGSDEAERKGTKDTSELALIKERVEANLLQISVAADIFDDRNLAACHVLLKFALKTNDVKLLTSLLALALRLLGRLY